MRIGASRSRIESQAATCIVCNRYVAAVANLLQAPCSATVDDVLRGAGRWVETGLVFTSGIGTPIDLRHVKRHLDPLLTKAGLPHFRVHDLRHSCASLLLAQEVPLKVVSDLLGHTQISITADLYTHVLPGVRKEAIDLMDRILTRESRSV
jgi:integrase